MRLEPLNGSPRAAKRPRTASVVFGIVLAVILVLGGLVILGAIVLFFVGLSHYGSNK